MHRWILGVSYHWYGSFPDTGIRPRFRKLTDMIAARREAEREALRITAKAEADMKAARSFAEARKIAAEAAADQKLRRLRGPASDSCGNGRDWRSPQIKAPAKMMNIVTTAAEISIESIGIATSF